MEFRDKLLIAELCQNHNGKSDLLSELALQAASSGATHLKIQGIYASELVYRERFEVAGSNALTRPFAPERERLAGLELTEETEYRFVELCHELGVTPMITIFTHSGLDRALQSGFRSFKIASYDCASIPLIQRCAEVADELVISTGGTMWDDVIRTANFLRVAPTRANVFMLHAVTKYPTDLKEVNLFRMLALSSLGFPIGFSDHTAPAVTGLVASLAAVSAGAVAIERHFTVLSPEETKDGPVSVSADQLRTIADAMSMQPPERASMLSELLQEYSEVLFTGSLEPSEFERINADYYRGRFASFADGQQVMAWEEWK